MRLLAAVWALPLAVPAAAQPGEPVTASSPDGSIEVTLTTDGDGRSVYCISRQGKPIIASSRLGFRYEFPDQPNLHQTNIAEELTEFNFAADGTAWWKPAFLWNREEYLINRTALSEVGTADTPENYANCPKSFKFIRDVPITAPTSAIL